MVKKKSERKPKNIMEAVGFQNIFNSEKQTSYWDL